MKTLFRQCFSVVALVLATATCALAQSIDTNYFLKVDGIPGESQGSGHVGEIDVVSFNLGVQQRGISDFGGGAGAGKSTFKPLVIHKTVDKSTPLLFLACATGKHIKTVEFTAVKQGSVPMEFLVIKLTDVLVSSINHVSAENDGQDLLMESVSLNYAKIEFKYTPVNANGAPGTPVMATFDLKKNKSL
jgi:type VI secretion system secreted protein Hcp